MRLSNSRFLLATALGLCVLSWSASGQAQPQVQPMAALAPQPAAPIPLPAPSTMAQAPGQPAGQPNSGPAPAAPSVLDLAKKDTLTVADVRDRLMATRDALWSYGDALASAALLKQYNERAAKISQAVPTLPAP